MLDIFVAFNAISSIIIPTADVLINPDKGFVLERIGTYSSEIETGIIHTFVPVDTVCDMSPATDRCIRMPKSKSSKLAIMPSPYMPDDFAGLLSNRNISLSIEFSWNNMLSVHGHG